MNKKILFLLFLINLLFADEDIQKAHRTINQLNFLSKMNITANYNDVKEILSIKDVRTAAILTDHLIVSPPAIQHYLIIKLSEMKATIAIPIISIIASNSPKWWIRTVAIEYLGKLKVTDVLPVILKALNDNNRFVRDMAITQLNFLLKNKIIFNKNQLGSKKNKNNSIAFWQKQKQTLLKKYQTKSLPKEDFTYYDPIFSFSFAKPQKTKCTGYVRKDKSISYVITMKDKDYDIWIKAEKNKEPKNKTILKKIKSSLSERLRDFNSSKWKPYKKLSWPSYQLRYTGKYKSDIIYFHSMIVILTNTNIYKLETAVPKKDKLKGVKFFFEIVKTFQIYK